MAALVGDEEVRPVVTVTGLAARWSLAFVLPGTTTQRTYRKFSSSLLLGYVSQRANAPLVAPILLL